MAIHLSQARALLRRHAYGLSWWLALTFVLYATYSLFMVQSRRLDQPYLIGMDPNYYFAWGRSVLMDGDIDFANDFIFIGGLDEAPEHARTRRDFALLMADPPATSTGFIPNKYGMGMGLLSLPLMSVARVASSVYSGVTGVEVSEFAAIYPMAMIATSVLMGFIGLAISYRILRDLYGRSCAYWATVAGCAGLSLIHYLIYEPAMAHAMGFGMASLFLLSALGWLRLLERCAERLNSPKSGEPGWSSSSIWKVALSAALMGWLLGVLCLVRYPDAVFALVPLVLAVMTYARRNEAERRNWIALLLLSLGCALAGTIAGFFPQLLAWKTLYGSWITYSYSGESLNAWPRYALLVLLGPFNSLFIWTPLAVVAVGGIALACRRGAALAVAGLAVIGALLWIYGSWELYWLGPSYGQRGFVDGTFFFMLGLAEFLSRLSRMEPRANLRRLGRGLVLLLVIWNVHFFFCYRAGIQRYGSFAGRRLITQGFQWPEVIARDFGTLFRPKFTLFTPKNPE